MKIRTNKAPHSAVAPIYKKECPVCEETFISNDPLTIYCEAFGKCYRLAKKRRQRARWKLAGIRQDYKPKMRKPARVKRKKWERRTRYRNRMRVWQRKHWSYMHSKWALEDRTISERDKRLLEIAGKPTPYTIFAMKLDPSQIRDDGKTLDQPNIPVAERATAGACVRCGSTLPGSTGNEWDVCGRCA